MWGSFQASSTGASAPFENEVKPDCCNQNHKHDCYPVDRMPEDFEVYDIHLGRLCPALLHDARYRSNYREADPDH
jgi:hypothetical protein